MKRAIAGILIGILAFLNTGPVSAASVDDVITLIRSVLPETTYYNTNSMSYSQVNQGWQVNLKVMNRTDRAVHMGVDNNSGLLFLSFSRNEGLNYLRPLGSTSFVMPAGDFMILCEGKEKAFYFSLSPGSAKLIIAREKYGRQGFDFIISQDGTNRYVTTGDLRRNFVRKVHYKSNNGLGNQGKGRGNQGNGRGSQGYGQSSRVKSVEIDPAAVFQAHGWRWHWKKDDNRSHGRSNDWKRSNRERHGPKDKKGSKRKH